MPSLLPRVAVVEGGTGRERIQVVVAEVAVGGADDRDVRAGGNLRPGRVRVAVVEDCGDVLRVDGLLHIGDRHRRVGHVVRRDDLHRMSVQAAVRVLPRCPGLKGRSRLLRLRALRSGTAADVGDDDRGGTGRPGRCRAAHQVDRDQRCARHRGGDDCADPSASHNTPILDTSPVRGFPDVTRHGDVDPPWAATDDHPR